MREELTTIWRGTFVVLEGQSAPDEFSTGQWQSWPIEVPDRDVSHVMNNIVPHHEGTVRFYFVDLRLFPDDVKAHFEEGHLKRFIRKHETVNESGYHYLNCTPLPKERMYQFTCSDEAAVKSGKKRGIVGSNGVAYALRPEDVVVSEKSTGPATPQAA